MWRGWQKMRKDGRWGQVFGGGRGTVRGRLNAHRFPQGWASFSVKKPGETGERLGKGWGKAGERLGKGSVGKGGKVGRRRERNFVVFSFITLLIQYITCSNSGKSFEAFRYLPEATCSSFCTTNSVCPGAICSSQKPLSKESRSASPRPLCWRQ